MELLAILVFGVFVFAVAKGIGQFVENENSPVVTVRASVADKRRRTHHHHSGGHHHHTHSYYITFSLDGGELLELRVHRSVYMELEAGDSGMLTHQGTRFKDFVHS